MQLVCPACATKNRVPDERLSDAPQCGRCGGELLAPEPFALDDTSFDGFVSGTDLPVLVDFWAEWCGPCRVMAPQFEQAARERADVRFAKVDTDASPKTSVRHRIRSIPTLALFHRGQEVARRSGAMSARDLLQWVDRGLQPR